MPTSHLVEVNLLSAHSLLGSFGAIGVFVVLFAETGLLIGFFLPGDSLLFTAGLLCSTTVDNTAHLSLPATLVAAASGALAGAQTGYWLGRRAGPVLLNNRSSGRITTSVARSHEYLERYGPAKAVILARFIPFLRTLINPAVGVIRMDVRTFVGAQVAGGLVWSLGVTLAGYALGSRVPSIDRYLLPIVAVVVAVSLTPIVLEVRRARTADGSKR